MSEINIGEESSVNPDPYPSRPPRYQFVTCVRDLCVGCQMCEFACAVVKEEAANILRSRIRLVRTEPVLMVSIACRACAEPACVDICPQPGAMVINPENGLVMVDNSHCDGCAHCIDACPFGVIALNPDTKLAVICDLCEDRAKGPACVEICPKDALEISTPEIIAQKARKGALRQLLEELAGLGSEAEQSAGRE
ncbi:MAG TPA: 4Fe-4S dicluster domain-containing protein [Rhodospirillales bacterium]|jgi:Fe-S-cluster-containing dehydrogenase component|nr:4Fe-4S dicluster domain-containing protein [Rhodospirillales bacterium]